MSTSTKMVLVDSAAHVISETTADRIPDWLMPNDLLVLNDAATLPASLHTKTASGDAVEVRLLDGPQQALTWAVLFGAGDYRTPTEHRPPPPELNVNDQLMFGDTRLSIAHVSPISPRLVVLHWQGSLERRFSDLYRGGRPVQYSYLQQPVALWDVQTAFASRPWAVEMPSAGRPLRADVLVRLRKRGVRLATLTHAAGLSSTGDPRIDSILPLPERYEIPERTVRQIEESRSTGGRVIAVGTSVVRALEDSAHANGRLQKGVAVATLVLSGETRRRVVDGLLTGIHIPGESHYRLLQAFVDDDTLLSSVEFANARGYQAHEFGDAALIVPDLLRARRRAA